MKKYILLLLVILCIPFTVNALEIKTLGFKSDDIKGLEIQTRDNMENSYNYYVNNIYAYGENDDYKLYIRAIDNPIEVDYSKDADLIDEVFGLLSVVNTNEYAYISNKDYKWIRFKYNSKDDNIPLMEYFLSWKDVFFTITFESKKTALTSDEIFVMDSFVKSINLDGKGKVEPSPIYADGIDTKPNPNYSAIIIEIVICITAIAITYYITRKKN